MSWGATLQSLATRVQALEDAGGGGAPSGAAGGDLSGTFPNPSVATVGGAAAATVAGQRTAHEAAFAHANLPTANQKAALVGTGTPSGSDLFVSNSDSRMTNARTPTSHASSHQNGGADEIASSTRAANTIPKTGAGGYLTSWIEAATTSIAGLLAAADYQKLVTYAHGTQTVELDIEAGTYGGTTAPTTSANREVRARVYDNTNAGIGRFSCRPLPGRTGGNVTMRLWTTLGASGAANEKVAWRVASGAYGIGDTLAASLPNTQTVYQDVSAQTAHVVTAFDITLTAAWFNQVKRQAFLLERLPADSLDIYTSGSVYVHAIELIYTGWGPIASPSAPS